MHQTRKRSLTDSVFRFSKNQPILLLFLAFLIAMVILRPHFMSVTNVRNILIDASIYGVAALAMTIAIICGEFDLSLSANFGWSQIFFCYLLNTWGDRAGGIVASLVCVLVVSTLIGCVNGLIVVKGKISAFIATLGTNMIIRGLALLFIGGEMINTSNEFITEFGRGAFLGISYITYVFIAVVLVAFFVMRYTRFGRNIYATGGNYNSAKLSGIKVDRYKFSIFSILGFAAGLAAALFVCLMRSGSVLYGTDLALTCVAATVIGGTPLSGGRGNVIKTVLGIILLYVLYRALSFLGIHGYYNNMIKGGVIMTVVMIDAYFTRSGLVARGK